MNVPVSGFRLVSENSSGNAFNIEFRPRLPSVFDPNRGAGGMSIEISHQEGIAVCKQFSIFVIQNLGHVHCDKYYV